MYVPQSISSLAIIANSNKQGRQVVLEILDTAGTEQFSEFQPSMQLHLSSLTLVLIASPIAALRYDLGLQMSSARRAAG